MPFLRDSLLRTHGLRPVAIMFGLLLFSEAVLHVRPVWDAVVRFSDRLWLDRLVTVRAEAVLPQYQIVAEEPMVEAYLRAIGRSGPEIKVLVMGDSEVALAPAGVAFHHSLKPVLEEAFAGRKVGVYCLAMRGMDDVAGFYLLKAASAQLQPDLVIYAVNSMYFGQVYTDMVRRDMGLVDEDYFAPAEKTARLKLLTRTRAMEEGWVRRVPYFWYETGLHAVYASRLRALMLPPAAFTGMGSRCYFAECQGTDNIYWRTRLAEVRQPGKDTLKNFHASSFGDDSIQTTYLKLDGELARSRRVRLIVLVPPKNKVMLEQFGLRDPALNAGRQLEAVLHQEGIPTISCLEAVPEQYFRGFMHLTAEGMAQWVGCLRRPLLQELGADGRSRGP